MPPQEPQEPTPTPETPITSSEPAAAPAVEAPITETPPATPAPVPVDPALPQAVIPPAPITPANPIEVPKKKRFPKWLKIIGILIIVIILFFVIVIIVVGSATKAPQKVSDQFVNDMQSSDSNAAYALTSSTFQKVATKETLDTDFKQLSPLLQGQEKITDREIKKSTGVPDTAVFVYSVKNSTATYYIKTELQKNSDSWQIINFRTSDKPIAATVE